MPDLEGAAGVLRPRCKVAPEIFLVLGSGLSHLAELVKDAESIGFEELPGFPPSGVAGHSGRFVAGSLGGVSVLLQAGRYHAYEGYGMDVLLAPLRVAALLGVHTLVVTNAAGGIQRHLDPGDLMLLEDHLNFMFRSPLLGPVREPEDRFPDLSAPYDSALQELARKVAIELHVELKRGTYAAVLGPSYETAAEVRMLGAIGADAVGMSTVPEVVAARARGIDCLGFSMVTNKGTGLSSQPIGHEEVIEVGRAAGARLGRLIEALLPEIVARRQAMGAR